MYNTSGIIPTRFLVLVAHFCLTVHLLWGTKRTALMCLPGIPSRQAVQTQAFQFVIGLTAVITLIAFEFLTFITGVSMFNPTSALTSIGCHGGAVILWTYLILDSWQCGWFWWIFVFGSVWPAFTDMLILVKLILRRAC